VNGLFVKYIAFIDRYEFEGENVFNIFQKEYQIVITDKLLPKSSPPFVSLFVNTDNTILYLIIEERLLIYDIDPTTGDLTLKINH
jgi:6-phosphogluconolactonase (cycloisomerase 2 family)